MEWDLQYEKDGYSIEAGLRKGRKPPKWYLEEPTPGRMDYFYTTAFNDLNTCRYIGMDIGPIPWDKINEYGHKAGLVYDILKAFIRIIRLMDDAYLVSRKETQLNKTDSGRE